MSIESKINREKLKAEVETVHKMDKDGLLRAPTMVQWARNNPNSVLYSQFEWDDTIAGEQYRIVQATAIIRTIVTHSPETNRTVKVWVSTPSDRMNGGGYRPSEEALRNARQEMCNEATKTLRQFRNRYNHLPELDALFDAIDLAVASFIAAQTKSKVA